MRHLGHAKNVIRYFYGTCKHDNKSERAKQRDPQNYVRKKWSVEEKRFSDAMFYCLFRMHRGCFHQLCNDIEKEVGKDLFKSESYLNELEVTQKKDRRTNLHFLQKRTVGDTISGEWKLAIVLRMMAGGTYLDMFLWSNVSPSEVCRTFNHVTKHWINATIDIDIYDDVFADDTRIKDITHEFALTSDGTMNGCLGSIDGWLVAILCPTLAEVNNPGKYFSRKGFYAINVQVICDKNKRILWRSIGQIGSIHDSRAFNISKLATYLKNNVDTFIRSKLYFVGDSAYALRPYLLTPYDNATPLSKQDTFNYFLSRNRIYVECVFGEINRRFGIFWKPLEGKLDRHISTIDAGLKLHNYIVEYRLAHTDDNIDFEEDTELQNTRRTFNINNPGEMTGMVTEEALLQNTRGRKTTEDRLLREKGCSIRDTIRDSLWNAGLRRPN